jgi:SAM-dependent methyltransferase
MKNKIDFDMHADSYDMDLSKALFVTGEDKDYFARGRIQWLSRYFQKHEHRPVRVMDYGCGTGSATPYLFDLPGVEELIGIDVSSKSLDVANRKYGSSRVLFLLFNQYKPGEEIDLVFSNGAFHHIPLNERASALDYIFRALRPGGLFAFWENNPWNPGTRYVMNRCPFDEDAVPISSWETHRLLTNTGFEIITTDYLFIFPKMFSWLRGIEPFVARLPLGGQYQVLCRKPR